MKRKRKMSKLLNNFLSWVDEETYWKEDNDVPNHIIVDEYIRQKKNEKLLNNFLKRLP